MDVKNNINFSPILTIILIALVTTIGSEIKLVPFEDAPFRFGLGTIIFLLAVLIKPVPILKTGIITGVTIVLWRVSLDYLFMNEELLTSFVERFPAALFYISFAFCLHKLNIELYKTKPLALGLFAAIFEIISNMIEEAFTLLFVTKHTIHTEEFILFITIAFIRSFSVVGIYSTITIAEQKKQVQQLLSIGSNLYVETMYLKKSMDHIEQITASSFELYKQLKPLDSNLSTQALMISQEIHEVKKDSQRIYSSLSKITTTKSLDSTLLSNLLHYITAGNKTYTEYHKKDIHFNVSYNKNFYIEEPIALLALLNNLVANAIEAIIDKGTINIAVNITKNKTVITVEDTGIGIPKTMLPIIFDAGFTTKFNNDGNASTGIGLSHVQSIIERLEGEIAVTSDETTKFTIVIPTHKLYRGDN
ncbi:ATP-binding protein [Lysinibacillus antri]|uniref:histidine kinase n=1 Tax=Lysinibacillus antri TaxID=2498145 RepID=A0A432L7W1_9BACI|nr:ATP-binding protein [Lysinibacillus antri]RUL48273.1 ATP-binding protein [Lysinibacillus antri]